MISSADGIIYNVVWGKLKDRLYSPYKDLLVKLDLEDEFLASDNRRTFIEDLKNKHPEYFV